MFEFYDRWIGLIPLLGGIYGLLLALGYLPRKPKDPEALERWRKRFGPLMKVLFPILIIGGLVSLLKG